MSPVSKSAKWKVTGHEHWTKEEEERNAVHLPFSLFPLDLRTTLEEIDEGGNGSLEFSEIVAMVKHYAELKKSESTGTISIDTLPVELHTTLKTFDVDGDGTVSTVELDRAASLYLEQLKQVKILTRVAIGTAIVLLLLLLTMSLTTLAVVEGTKETKASSNGVVTAAGDSGTVAASASAVVEDDLYNSLFYTADRLRDVSLLTLPLPGSVVAMYQVLSATLNKGNSSVEFYTGVNNLVVNVTNSRFTVSTDACENVGGCLGAVHIVERNDASVLVSPGTTSKVATSATPTAPAPATVSGRRRSLLSWW